jgi:hypothetical protein
MKHKYFFFFVVGLLAVSAVRAQSAAESEAILAPILTLVRGMNLGDSAMVRTAFANEVSMVTLSTNPAGSRLGREYSIKKFLAAVGTPHAEPWSEPIWDVRVQTDGNFAQVWASYAFYIGKKFSHCGVDAFHLSRDANGEWKIFHLTDTRNRDNCNVPASVRSQFEGQKP